MNVEAIYVYPIKSLRGISLQTATLDEHGFKYDRTFVLLKVLGDGEIGHGSGRLDAKRTAYMSIADIPWMCLFEVTEIGEKELVVDFHKPCSTARDTLRIPLQPDLKNLDRVETEMWESKLDGYAMSEAYNAWFSHRFGFRVVLVYIGPGHRAVLGNIAPNAAVRNPERRRTRELQNTPWSKTSMADVSELARSWISPKAETDYSVTFADYAPLLVVTSRSCEEVSARLAADEPMDIRKFRPNIVVAGAAGAFEEDYWAELSIGEDARISLTSNCVRCTSLNVDFRTGEIGTGDSGKVLRKLQADRRVDRGVKYSPVFGRYGFLSRDGPEALEIRVNDSVVVKKRAAERTTFKWPGMGEIAKDDWFPV